MIRVCETCKAPLVRPKSASERQWIAKRFCSQPCKSRAPRASVVDRFWAKVERMGQNECWPWKGTRDKYGYGRLANFPKGSPLKAYRVSWALANGPVPAGVVVRHKCDNPPCVNPTHLELGTQKDNARDTSARGRLNPKSLLNLRHDKALSTVDMEMVVEMRSRGLSLPVIAKRFGVDSSTVGLYLRGKRTPCQS